MNIIRLFSFKARKGTQQIFHLSCKTFLSLEGLTAVKRTFTAPAINSKIKENVYKRGGRSIRTLKLKRVDTLLLVTLEFYVAEKTFIME